MVLKVTLVMYNIIPNIFVQIYLNSLLHYMSHCCLVDWYERFLGLRVTTVSFGKNVYYLFVRFTNFLDLLLSHYNHTRTRVGLLTFNSLTHLLYRQIEFRFRCGTAKIFQTLFP